MKSSGVWAVRALALSAFGVVAYAGPVCGFALNGLNWVNSCDVAATHALGSTAFMSGIVDGNSFTLTASGMVKVWTGVGSGGALQTEIYDMTLIGSGITVTAGDGVADGVQTAGARAEFYTGGTITQQGNGEFADSFFDVFFQIDLQAPNGPLVLHNNQAQHTASVINQIPRPMERRTATLSGFIFSYLIPMETSVERPGPPLSPTPAAVPIFPGLIWTLAPSPAPGCCSVQRWAWLECCAVSSEPKRTLPWLSYLFAAQSKSFGWFGSQFWLKAWSRGWRRLPRRHPHPKTIVTLRCRNLDDPTEDYRATRRTA